MVATRFSKNLPSKADVPGYFDVIEKPMCWKVIDKKLDKRYVCKA